MIIPFHYTKKVERCGRLRNETSLHFFINDMGLMLYIPSVFLGKVRVITNPTNNIAAKK